MTVRNTDLLSSMLQKISKFVMKRTVAVTQACFNVDTE